MYRYQPKKTKKGKTFFIYLLSMIIVSVTSIYIYSIYANINIEEYTEKTTTGIETQRLSVNSKEEIITEEKSITKIIEETIPSIVGISKIKNTGSSIFLKEGTKELGLGTGVIVSENGYILTNWHVSGEKYSNCYITLENGEVHNGNVVWADSDLDLALIKINVLGLKSIKFADSDKILVGEKVYAIGNPIGIEFQRTVTSGIISGKERTIKIEEENKTSYMENLIQTDATINPGNSGGALINEKGEMIGINSIKIETAEGIGFAIPINIVKTVIEKYIQTGDFSEGYIGIFAYDKKVIPYLDKDLNFSSGIYVAQISKDGPSAKNDLKIGDIITKIDNYEINTMSELRNYIYTKQPNDKVNLTVLRNKKEINIEITLGKK